MAVQHRYTTGALETPRRLPYGTAAKRPAATKPLTVPLGEPTPQPAGNPADRRKQPRGAFEEQVARLDAEGESVLLGQDLSKRPLFYWKALTLLIIHRLTFTELIVM